MDKKNWNQNMDLIFEKPNQESKAIDDAIRDELAKTTDRYALYEKYGNPFKNTLIITGISRAMTPLCPEKAKKAQLDFVKDFGFLKYYHLTENGMAFAFDNGDRYEISRLDRFVDDGDLKLKLTTQEKENDCHRGSWNLMNHLDNIKGKNIVTSFITGASEDAKYLHTWVEFENQGRELVADYTINAIMDKNLYYALKGVDMENITTISEEDFKQDRETIKPLIDDKKIQLRQYLFFRDQMMKDIVNEKGGN